MARKISVVVTLSLFIGLTGSASAFNGPPPGSPPTGDGSIVTNASNNVGIGTTNPGSRLTVRNSSAGTIFAIRNTADTANTFAVSDAGAITAGSVGWSLLTNFPAGCPAGQAVQTISGAPSCIAVGIGTVTSVSGSGGATGLALNGGPITTSGTLTIGGVLSATSGGTAQSTYIAGDLLYASGVNTLGKRTIGSAGQVLTVSGGVPVWATPSAGTVTSVSGSGGATGLTLTGGPITTSGTLTIGGTLAATNGGTGLTSPGVSGNVLTSNGVGGWTSSAPIGDISGVTAGTGLTGGGATGAVTLNLAVPVAAINGGTAQTTYAAGDLLYSPSANALAKRAIGTAGQVLTVSGGLPMWATPSSGTVTSVSGSGGTTGLTLSGGPITTSGTLTIGGTLAVANGGTGLISPGISGNVLTSNGVGGWVSQAEIGDISGITAGTGLTGGGASGAVTLNLAVPVAATNGGTAQTTYTTGDLLYASAANTLTKRTIGSAGQVLTVSGGVPAWATPATGVGGSGTTNNIAKFTGATTVGNSQLVDTGTNVGIGVTAPNELLEVAAAGGARAIVSDGGGAVRQYLLLQAPSSVQTYARILGYQAAIGPRNLILQDSGGNVGIGTVNPAQKLDVAGTVQSTGFKLTTGAVNGYVLKADAAGIGTWQADTAGTVTSVSGSGGITGLTLTGGPITTSGTLTIGGTLAVANGGTGSTDAATARTNLGAAASGANSDITALTGLTTPLAATRGGTAQSTYVSGDILYASSAFSIARRAIGFPGQVLTVSAGAPVWAAPSSGTVTSVSGSGGTTGLTLSGGPITTSGTLTIGGTLAVANGGTGATTAAGARSNLGAAASGANSDITSLSGLTTPLSPAQGGTGQTALGAANQILGVNNAGATSEYKTLVAGSNVNIVHGAGSVTISASAGGETNTASNIGVGGVGVFKQKTGVNLEFKNINAGSGKLTVTNDAVNNEVDIDVAEGSLNLANLGGTLSTAQGGTGVASPGTSGNVLTSNGTAWVSASAPAPARTVVKMGYPTWSGSGIAEGPGYGRSICPSGKKVVGGGCRRGTSASEAFNCRLASSFPVTTGDGDVDYNPLNQEGWYCEWRDRNDTAVCGAGSESAFAICE